MSLNKRKLNQLPKSKLTLTVVSKIKININIDINVPEEMGEGGGADPELDLITYPVHNLESYGGNTH